jgi:hypothetical protein
VWTSLEWMSMTPCGRSSARYKRMGSMNFPRKVGIEHKAVGEVFSGIGL